ncbi:MAG TPA: Mth938-like domain-containing protein [Rhodocyclaceae bacterium]|jgi:uncharacterized protein|nr:Mth938-like domain-containing protein [Rhodocyclaceae bacterium]
MKLHSDPKPGNTISAYGEGYVSVNGVQHGSIIVQPETLINDWPVRSFNDLTSELIADFVNSGADILLLGTGKRQHFLPPGLLKIAVQAGKPLDVMDTAAACRTYNILMSEGRRVAAALIVEQ